MLNNYQYFLMLAKELNISSASEKLFISHQCLSKYLKNLEKYYDIALFERKPSLRLTPAGEILLKAFKDIEFSDQNIKSEIENLKNTEVGTVNLGITEGRYPIVVPRLLKEFQKLCPHVHLNIINTTTPKMREMTLNNELDLFLSGLNYLNPRLSSIKIMDEKLYLVISDNLLKQFFLNYPDCIEEMEKGVDLRNFSTIPCILNKINFNSRTVIDRYLAKEGLTLNCIAELTQPDMHYRLTAEDMAISFCLTMYLDGIKHINQLQKLQGSDNLLHVFPIKNLTETNPLGLMYLRGKILPSYTKKLCNLIKTMCRSYSTM